MNGWTLPIAMVLVGIFASLSLGYYRMTLKAENYEVENTILKAKLGSTQTALDVLTAQYKALEATMAEREKQLDLMQKERETARKNFQKVVQDDKSSRDWSTTAIPDRVREVLTGSDTSCGEANATDVPVRPRGGTGVCGDN